MDVLVICNEGFVDGVCVRAECFDIASRTYRLTEFGVVVEERLMTSAEWKSYGPKPLDAAGVMATLNAVLGIWSVEDAANAVGLTPDDLVAEAQAWAVAGS